MIPNINSSMIVPPSPRRHAHFAVPIDKINSHQNFLSIVSIPMTIQPSIDLRGEFEDKPYIRVVNKDSNDPTDTVIQLEKSRLMIRKNSLVERREISIPNNREMPRVHTMTEHIEDRPHKKLHTELNYLRNGNIQTIPTADVYEATDNDLKFLFELNQEIFNGHQNSFDMTKITDDQFESLIVAWENETAENDPISLEHAIDLVDSSSCLRNKILIDQNILIRNEALTKIYNYWNDLREQYRRPLLRKWLKVTNKDYTNPNIAFLRRKENKFARRRSQRTSSPIDDFQRMKNLKKNVERSSLLLANVKYREMLKFELHEIKNKYFEDQVKEQLGEDFNLFEMSYPKMENICNSEIYKEAKRKMEECNKKGQSVVRSLNNMRKDSFKAELIPEPKRKLSSVQPSSTSSTTSSLSVSTATSTTHSYKPMSLGLSKMTSSLPKNIQGSFTLPIKKSSIDLKDLRFKLRQSLGGLYLKSQDEHKIRVEIVGTNSKMEEEHVDKENKNTHNLPNKMMKEHQEELLIRVELEEHVERVEGEKPVTKTTVRYSIKFRESSTTATTSNQSFPFENVKSQNPQSMSSEFGPLNAKVKS